MIEDSKANHDMISLKFEPFILHICCRSLEHAKSLVIINTKTNMISKILNNQNLFIVRAMR